MGTLVGTGGTLDLCKGLQTHAKVGTLVGTGGIGLLLIKTEWELGPLQRGGPDSRRRPMHAFVFEERAARTRRYLHLRTERVSLITRYVTCTFIESLKSINRSQV